MKLTPNSASPDESPSVRLAEGDELTPRAVVGVGEDGVDLPLLAEHGAAHIADLFKWHRLSVRHHLVAGSHLDPLNHGE